MGIFFSAVDYFRAQEVPVLRKFQRIISLINQHVLHRGKFSENPAPFEHFSESVMWDDGIGGGASAYAKLLDKERFLIERRNDREATLILSHTPDEVADGQLFLEEKSFVCDGSNDSANIQYGIDRVMGVGGGKIFLKNGKYEITTGIKISVPIAAYTVLEFDGERGAILSSQTPDPAFQIIFSVTQQGIYRIIFRNLTFHNYQDSLQKIFQVDSTSTAKCELVFKNCTFAFASDTSAININSSTSGLAVIFEDCVFRKFQASYYSMAVVVIGTPVKFLRCLFLDIHTANTAEDSWTRRPYTPFDSSITMSDYFLVKADDERIERIYVDPKNNISTIPAPSDSKSIISKPLVYTRYCNRVEIIDCEFRHYDTVILFDGREKDVLVLSGNQFYQFGAYLYPERIKLSDQFYRYATCMVHTGGGRAVIHDNIFLSLQKRDSPSFYTWSTFAALAFNTMLYPLRVANGSTVGLNFMLSSPDPLHQFHVWKTERDLPIPAEIVLGGKPKNGNLSGDTTDEDVRLIKLVRRQIGVDLGGQ